MQTQEGRKSANDKSLVVSSYASTGLQAAERAAGPTPRIVDIRTAKSKAKPTSSMSLANNTRLDTLDVVNYQEPDRPKQPRFWKKHRDPRKVAGSSLR